MLRLFAVYSHVTTYVLLSHDVRYRLNAFCFAPIMQMIVCYIRIHLRENNIGHSADSDFSSGTGLSWHILKNLTTAHCIGFIRNQRSARTNYSCCGLSVLVITTSINAAITEYLSIENIHRTLVQIPKLHLLHQVN